jgi:hypothetical protein
MRKNREGFRVLLLSAAAATTVMIVTACTNPVSEVLKAKSWGMVGTWGNSSYVAAVSVTRAGLLSLNADGTYRYSDPSGGSPQTGAYTVGDVTVSGAVRTYQIKFVSGPPTPGTTYWVLAQVTDGTTYESVSDMMGLAYPTSLASGSNYGILTLQ